MCGVHNQSVSQVFAAVATSLHCERSCARENVSVRDMPVSEEINDQARWFWVVHLNASINRRISIFGSTTDREMLDAGTSRRNLATWPHNPNYIAYVNGTYNL